MQRTRSLPVHTSPQTMLMFQQPGRKQTFAFSLCHTLKGRVSVAWKQPPGCPWSEHGDGSKQGRCPTL